MITANVLANNILKRAFAQKKYPVTPMKLQKLLYITYKKYLQKTGKRIFAEDFMAWKYGPVVPSVYEEFQHFKDKPITEFYKKSNGEVSVANEKVNLELSDILDEVWDNYKIYNGIELSELTHKKGSAWYNAFYGGKEALCYADISKEDDYLNK